jgi:hypothetical protein
MATIPHGIAAIRRNIAASQPVRSAPTDPAELEQFRLYLEAVGRARDAGRGWASFSQPKVR